MSSCRSVVLAVLAGALLALAGCQNKTSERDRTRPAIADEDVSAIRERYMRLDPNNRVGVVTAVHEASNLAAVGELPLQDFGIGDVLVFVDARERPFNSGQVVNATANALHVKYESNERAPRVGELAVRLAR